MSGFVDVEVATVAIDLDHRRPLALLHQDWESVLPVWVGTEEALAIARARRGIAPPRPLTHDLFTNVLEGLGGTLEEVLVYDMQENVYRGLLRVRVDNELREFDARPSDGLALAVRTGARIRVDPRLFEAAPDVDFISMEEERPIVRMRGITVSSARRADPTGPDTEPSGVLVLHAAGISTPRLVQRGDVILRVGDRQVNSPRRFLEAVQGTPDDVGLRLTLTRNGEELQVHVPPPAQSSRGA